MLSVDAPTLSLFSVSLLRFLVEILSVTSTRNATFLFILKILLSLHISTVCWYTGNGTRNVVIHLLPTSLHLAFMDSKAIPRSLFGVTFGLWRLGFGPTRDSKASELSSKTTPNKQVTPESSAPAPVDLMKDSNNVAILIECNPLKMYHHYMSPMSCMPIGDTMGKKALHLPALDT